MVRRDGPAKRSPRRTAARRTRPGGVPAQAETAGEEDATQTNESESTPDREERQVEGRSSDSYGGDLYDDLRGLEGSYYRAQSNLFPRGGYGGIGGYGGNPFSDALGDDEPEGGDDSPDGNGGGGEGNGDGNGDPTGSDQPATPVDTEPPPPVPGGGDSPASKFSFLLLFDAGSAEEVQVSRAHHDGDGSFTLEDGGRLGFFPSLVNAKSPVLTLEPGKAVMTGDMNRDGLADLFVVSWEHLGTALQTLLARGTGGWQEHFKFFWPYQVARSFALYDFDADGVDELVAAFSDSGNLFIYEVAEQGLQFDREVVVPFNATWVVKTHDSGAVGGDYLEVFDSSLSVSVTFSSRFPGIYSFARPPTYLSSVQVDLDSLPGLPAQSYLVLRYRDRTLLFETTGNFAVQLGSFDKLPRFPSVIVGDFFDIGARQLIMVP